MQTKSHLSRPHCVSVLATLAAAALLAFANPARSQTIMCVPGASDEDHEEIVWVDADDHRDRDGGILWFLAGGIPALFELFHHDGSSHSAFHDNVGPQLPGSKGGIGSDGSWSEGPGGTGNPGSPDNPGSNDNPDNPPAVVVPQDSAAVPEPGQLAFLAAPLAAGLVMWRRKRPGTSRLHA